MYSLISFISLFGNNFKRISLFLNIAYGISILLLASYLINLDSDRFDNRNIQFKKIISLFVVIIFLSISNILIIFKVINDALILEFVLFSIVFILLYYAQVIHSRDCRRILISREKVGFLKENGMSILMEISTMMEQIPIPKDKWFLKKTIINTTYRLEILIDVRDDKSFTLSIKGEGGLSDQLLPIYLYHSKLPKNENIELFVQDIGNRVIETFQNSTL